MPKENPDELKSATENQVKGPLKLLAVDSLCPAYSQSRWHSSSCHVPRNLKHDFQGERDNKLVES